MAIHSQLISCSASEVAAMIEGAMRHGTTFDVEGDYTDSHGQSQIGFGITRLLDFELRPRIKQIIKTKLYQDQRGDRARYPGLIPALTRPIRWPHISAQYDQMVDEQELTILCLRLLQAAMVYVNTLMIQSLLAQPGRADLLTTEDRRALTHLIWAHMTPYGEVRLDMSNRLPLAT